MVQVNIKICRECAKAIKLSGAEIVTVAVRRVNIFDKSKPLSDGLHRSKKNYLSCQILLDVLILKEALRTLKISKRNRRMET